MAVLKRGYSIVQSVPGHQIITRARDVQRGDLLEVLLFEGKIKVVVDK
jgi:exonuclease VII large subunit